MKKSPPPDTHHEPVYQGELTLEVVYSRTKIYRSIISRDANARFRVRCEKWEASWFANERSSTIAVSLETARTLAEEKLKETPDGLSHSTA